MTRALPLTSLLLALGGCASTGAVRKEFRHQAIIQAPPQRVFPLLCPVKENEWIEGWHGEVLFSRSGFAEDNGLFRTHLRFGEVWVTTRYEPEAFRVEYTIFASDHAVVRMDLALDDLADGTSRLRTRRTYTGLDWLGRRGVDATSSEEIDAAQALLARQLDHYLATGTPLTARPR